MKNINSNLLPQKSDESNINSSQISENLLSTDNKKIPKKRGRRPKEKKEENKPKVKGKRGRRPINKFKYDSNLKPNISNINNNDNIILKLPIECLNTETDMINDLLPYQPKIPSPKPYDIDANNYKQFDNNQNNNVNYEYLLYGENDDNDTNINSNILDGNIITNTNMDDNNINNNQNNIQSNFLNNITTNSNNLNNKCKYCKCIKNDEEQSNISNNRLIDNLLNKKKNSNNFIEIMVQICNSENNNKWLKKTDACCYWCCYQFDETPWGIPYKLENDIFSLYGIFCSPNCTMSYLINNENSDTLWDKIALLHLLYFKIYNKYDNILPAPNKISLKKFGGSISIEEFRDITKTNIKTYDLKFPPCNSIVPVLEEVYKNKSIISSFIPIDNNKLNRATNELKLKRNKPINLKKNTLDSCMNIVYNTN